MYYLYNRETDRIEKRFRTLQAIKKFIKKHYYDPYAPESMAYAEDELLVYKDNSDKYKNINFRGSTVTIT